MEILAAAGLPRDPINGLVADSFGRGWFGRKAEDCRLLVDVGEFALLPGDARPDSLLKTWVHESLHARQLYAAGFRQEWRDVAGFEEGMVEGLTYAAAIDVLGLQPAVTNYRYYVAAYRSLATVLEIDIEQLWRGLWRFPAGEVRMNFLSVIERILREQQDRRFTALQRVQLNGFADRYFSTRRMHDQPDELAMLMAWRGAVG